MRNLQIILVVLIIIVGIMSGCIAYAKKIITPEQAMLAVRSFENDRSIRFGGAEVYNYECSIDWLSYKEYEIKAANSNNYYWVVDPYIAEVIAAVYHARIPNYKEDHPVFGKYSQALCKNIALTYAKQKYQGFKDMNFIAETPKWKGSGWIFIWHQKLLYDALTFNHIEIDINPDTGEIQRYFGRRVGWTQPSQALKISSQEAIEIAKKAFGKVTIHGSPNSTLIADPSGNLYWNVGMEYSYSGSINFYDNVYINMSGLVFHETWTYPSGMQESDEKKQLQKSNTKVESKSITGIPLNTIEFPSGEQIEKIKVDKNSATFMYNTKLYKLNNDSNILILGTKKYKMNDKCIIDNFIVYVPYDFRKTLIKTTKPAKTIKSTKIIKAITKKPPVKAKK